MKVNSERYQKRDCNSILYLIELYFAWLKQTSKSFGLKFIVNILKLLVKKPIFITNFF